MSEYREYREAMKSYRRTQNFARTNYALPFILPALGSVVSGLKIVATLMLLFSFAKETTKLIFQKVPYFFSRLKEYRTKSKEYAKDQEVINQKRSRLMENHKKLLLLLKDVGEELAEVMKASGNPKYNQTVALLKTLRAQMESPEYKAFLDGKPVTDEAIRKQAEVLKGFMKSYDEAYPEKSSGLIGTLAGFFPFAGYMAGGPQAVDALTSRLISERAAMQAGSLAEMGVHGAIKGLGVANKVNSFFFSMPMMCVSIGSMVAGGIANSVLQGKIEDLANVMANSSEDLAELDRQNMALTATIDSFKAQFSKDIEEVKEVIKNDPNASASTKASLEKNLSKLETKLRTNFSAITEAAGTLVKTGVGLLKNKTFDTAMLGLIAGMAIEKYKNKQEEELANKLLTEEANKMKKFKFN